MKKAILPKNGFYFLALLMFAVALAACSGSGTAKEEDTETEVAPPAEESIGAADEDMPEQVAVAQADNRIQVLMEKVGPSEDTAAALISGYIDLNSFAAKAGDIQLGLQAKTPKDTREYTMKIEDDGRVPGTWVAPDADCHFTLTLGKEKYSFDARVATALYRFKLSLKAGI